MTETIYFKLHIGDFIGDTLDMDALEVGAFFLMLMAHYKNGLRGIPSDDKKLRRIARVEDRRIWARVKESLVAKFEEVDGFLVHPRVVSELEKRGKKGPKNPEKDPVDNFEDTDEFVNESVRKLDDKTLIKHERQKPIHHPSSINVVNKHPSVTSAREVPGVSGVTARPGGYRVMNWLTEDDLQQARAVARGWDLHMLAGVYDGGIEAGSRPMPKNPRKPAGHFVGFCRAYTKARKPA